MIFFPLQDLPQKHLEHENLDNGVLTLPTIFGLLYLQCVHQDHIKKRTSQKRFFLGSFVIWLD